MTFSLHPGPSTIDKFDKLREDRAMPRALRYPIRMAVRYRRVGESLWLEGTTENISNTGVLFRTAQPMEKDTPVELLMTLPKVLGQAARVSCRGKVVRVVTGGPSAIAATIREFRFLRVADPLQKKKS